MNCSVCAAAGVCNISLSWRQRACTSRHADMDVRTQCMHAPCIPTLASSVALWSLCGNVCDRSHMCADGARPFFCFSNPLPHTRSVVACQKSDPRGFRGERASVPPMLRFAHRGFAARPPLLPGPDAPSTQQPTDPVSVRCGARGSGGHSALVYFNGSVKQWICETKA